MKDKLRILLTGCGKMSRAWLNAACARDDATIVGLADLDEAAALEKKADFHLTEAQVSTDFAALIAETKPDIVFDCTVPEVHAKVVLTALEHGCHALGEKPMADNLDDAKKMVAAAKRAGKLHAVIQNRRYMRAIRTVRNVLKSGAIGKVHTVNADFYKGCHFGGFRDEMRHVLLLDMAIHSFDQARYLMDLDPVSVFCKEFNPPGSWYRHDASAMAVFEMDGGAVFNYRGSWCAEGLETSWQCAWRIVGAKGSLLWDGENEIRAEVALPGEGFTRERQPLDILQADWDETRNGHAGLIHDFLDSVKSGKTLMTAGSDNIKSLAMVMAAVESSEKGEPRPVVWT